MDDRSDITTESGLPGSALPTAAERRLVASVLAGAVADLEGASIRGTILADLICGRNRDWPLPSAGVWIAAAVIEGGLDLALCTVAVPVVLRGCRLAGGPLDLRDATFDRLSLADCELAEDLDGDRLRTQTGLSLDRTAFGGALSLGDARIGGMLGLAGCTVAGGIALTRATIAGTLDLSGAAISPPLAVTPVVDPEHAAEGGTDTTLAVEDGTDTSAAGNGASDRPALDATGMHVDGDVILIGAAVDGGVSLTDARIAGRLLAGDAAIESHSHGFAARRSVIGGRVDLSNANLIGPLDLASARIGGDLDARDVEIEGSGTAIEAASAVIEGSCDLTRARLVGEVRLARCRLGGDLVASEARFFGTEQAVDANRISIGGGCRLERCMVVGRIDLTGARIEDAATLAGATLKVETGAALALGGASFGRDLDLSAGLHTIGAILAERVTIAGTLDLRGSHLRAAAIAPASTKTNTARPVRTIVSASDPIAVSLAGATIGRLIMPQRGDERPHGILDLSHARAGIFEDWAAAWPLEPRKRARDRDGRDIDHLVLDGFSYGLLANPSGRAPGAGSAADAGIARARIGWLDGQRREDAGRDLRRQPWVALANRLTAQGHTAEANRIAIALARRERRSRSSTAGARWQSRFADWLTLHGTSPWRGLALMAIMTMVLAAVWAVAAGRCASPGCLDESVFVISNKAAYTEPRFERTYPRFNAIGYSLDLTLPVLRLGYADHWRPNVAYAPLVVVPIPATIAGVVGATTLPITLGGLLYALGVAQRLAGLLLAVMVLATVSGVLRRRMDT